MINPCLDWQRAPKLGAQVRIRLSALDEPPMEPGNQPPEETLARDQARQALRVAGIQGSLPPAEEGLAILGEILAQLPLPAQILLLEDFDQSLQGHSRGIQLDEPLWAQPPYERPFDERLSHLLRELILGLPLATLKAPLCFFDGAPYWTRSPLERCPGGASALESLMARLELSQDQILARALHCAEKGWLHGFEAAIRSMPSDSLQDPSQIDACARAITSLLEQLPQNRPRSPKAAQTLGLAQALFELRPSLAQAFCDPRSEARRQIERASAELSARAAHYPNWWAMLLSLAQRQAIGAALPAPSALSQGVGSRL